MRNKPRKIPVPTPKPERAQGEHRKDMDKYMTPSYVQPDKKKSKQKKDFSR